MHEPQIIVRCFMCSSTAIRFPHIRALPGHAVDASKAIVTCDDCGQDQTVKDATKVIPWTP